MFNIKLFNYHQTDGNKWKDIFTKKKLNKFTKL